MSFCQWIPVASGYQEIHPFSAIDIDSVKINTSLIMMKECRMPSAPWKYGKIALFHSVVRIISGKVKGQTVIYDSPDVTSTGLIWSPLSLRAVQLAMVPLLGCGIHVWSYGPYNNKRMVPSMVVAMVLGMVVSMVPSMLPSMVVGKVPLLGQLLLIVNHNCRLQLI